ncbi:MAG: hypothetical protein NVS2B7_04000 [Herpetosiphon sp.]
MKYRHLAWLLLPLLIAGAQWLQPRSISLQAGDQRTDRFFHNFYPRERWERGAGRWSSPGASFELPAPRSVAIGRFKLATTATRAVQIGQAAGVGIRLPRAPRGTASQMRQYAVLLVDRNVWWRGQFHFDVKVTEGDEGTSADPRKLGVFVEEIRVAGLGRGPLVPPLVPLGALICLIVLMWMLLRIGQVGEAAAAITAAVVGSVLALGWLGERLWVEPYLWQVVAGLGWVVALAALARWRHAVVVPAPVLLGLLLADACGIVVWGFGAQRFSSLWNWTALPLLLLLPALSLFVLPTNGRRIAGAAILVIGGVYAVAVIRAQVWRVGAVDFAALFQGPHDAWHGQALYHLDDIRRNPFADIYKYPPFFALLMAPLTGMDATSAFRTWVVVQGAALLVGAGVIWYVAGAYARRWSTVWLILLLALFKPLTDSLRYGQPDALLFLLVALGFWASSRQRWVTFGIVIGIATAIKLYPAYLLLLPLIRGRWRAVGGWGMGLAGCTLASIVALGPAVHLIYLRDVLPHSGGGTAWVENQTINGFLARFDSQATLALVPLRNPAIMAATYAAALAGTIFVGWWCRRLPDDLAYGLVITTLLIVLPAAWFHYEVLLLLPLYLLFVEGERTGGLPWKQGLPFGIAAALLCFGNQWTFYNRTLHGPFWELVLSYKFYGLLVLCVALCLAAKPGSSKASNSLVRAAV